MYKKGILNLTLLTLLTIFTITSAFAESHRYEKRKMMPQDLDQWQEITLPSEITVVDPNDSNLTRTLPTGCAFSYQTKEPYKFYYHQGDSEKLLVFFTRNYLSLILFSSALYDFDDISGMVRKNFFLD